MKIRDILFSHYSIVKLSSTNPGIGHHIYWFHRMFASLWYVFIFVWFWTWGLAKSIKEARRRNLFAFSISHFVVTPVLTTFAPIAWYTGLYIFRILLDSVLLKLSTKQRKSRWRWILIMLEQGMKEMEWMSEFEFIRFYTNRSRPGQRVK